MEESNINWILAIACLLAGIGIGALGYRLLGAGAGTVQKLRQRLAERDRQLTELRDGVNDHFAHTAELVERLRRDSQALQQEIDESGARLGVETASRPSLEPIADAAVVDQREDLAVPRDYADGNRGTLSEDFGLKSGEPSAPQPPRY